MTKVEFQEQIKMAEWRGFNRGIRAALRIIDSWMQDRFKTHDLQGVRGMAETAAGDPQASEDALPKPNPSVKRSAKTSKPSAQKMSAMKKSLRGSAATETSTPTILKTSKRGKNATGKRQRS